MPWLASISAFLAGALVTVQAGSNAQLKQGLGTPMPALLVNYVLGFTAVLGYALLTRVPWPAVGQATSIPWWAWLGGAAGAFYGVAAILLAHSLGAATLMALAVGGQLFGLGRLRPLRLAWLRGSSSRLGAGGWLPTYDWRLRADSEALTMATRWLRS